MTGSNPRPTEASLEAAAREMSTVSDELARWRSSEDPANSQRLEMLQRLLQQIQSTDGRAAEARRDGIPSAAIGAYESALKRALAEIQILEQFLDGERNRLSPRLDAAHREQQFRTAYARTLSRH